MAPLGEETQNKQCALAIQSQDSTASHAMDGGSQTKSCIFTSRCPLEENVGDNDQSATLLGMCLPQRSLPLRVIAELYASLDRASEWHGNTWGFLICDVYGHSETLPQWLLTLTRACLIHDRTDLAANGASISRMAWQLAYLVAGTEEEAARVAAEFEKLASQDKTCCLGSWFAAKFLNHGIRARRPLKR